MGEEEERTKVQSQDLIGVMDRRGAPRREKGSRMAGGLIQRGFCRGHDCVIDVGVSSRKFKHPTHPHQGTLAVPGVRT